jgi:DNA-binding NarL/FixJ family response regulator
MQLMAGSEMPTRVFLVDDHEVVRTGLRELLELTGEFSVVGEAATAYDAVRRITATRPQVAVLDVRLPDGNGIEVCRDVRSALPDLGCLMLTSFADDEALFDSIMAGAAGYVLKQVRGNDLVDAVRTVAAGRSLLDPAVTARVLERIRRGDDHDNRLDDLTDHERRILDLIGEGMTNRQIATTMFLTEKTIKSHVSGLLQRLGMTRRTQAAAFIAQANEHRRRRYDL